MMYKQQCTCIEENVEVENDVEDDEVEDDEVDDEM